MKINLDKRTLSTQAEFDSYMNAHCNMEHLYRCKIDTAFAPSGWSSGGVYIINGFMANNYGWQEAHGYWGYTYCRCCKNGLWSGWESYITNSDFEYFDGVVTVAPGTTNTVSITYKNHYAVIPIPVAVVGGTAVDPQYVHWTVRSRSTTGCVIAITNTHPSTSIQPSIYGSVMAAK